MSYERPEIGERPRVAYFCMEYGLDERLPIYSGGLGVLAGDFMRSAHALGLPVVGVGIVWAEGYTTQRIGARRRDRGSCRRRSIAATWRSEAPTVTVTIGGRDVPLAIWRVDGLDNAPLYLLEPIDERDRWITRRLYGGGKDDRVAQEIVLGVGGVRALAGARPRRRRLPLQRGARAVRRARADAAGARARARLRRGVGRDARADRVHHAHADRRRQRGARPRAAACGSAPTCGLTARAAGAHRRRAVQHDGRRAAAVARAPTPSPSCTARRRARCGGTSTTRAPIVAITNGVDHRVWQDAARARRRSTTAATRRSTRARRALQARAVRRGGARAPASRSTPSC